jgi:cation transport ATPase
LEIHGDILSVELTRTGRLTDGDHVLCVAGEIVPATGAVVGGRALLRDVGDASEWRVAVGSRVLAGMYVAADYVVICIDAIGDRPPPTATLVRRFR